MGLVGIFFCVKNGEKIKSKGEFYGIINKTYMFMYDVMTAISKWSWYLYENNYTYRKL